MSGWWVHGLVQDGRVLELVAWIFWVLLSITLHELGHGVAAIRQGDRTPIETGRMTFNPIVHMGGLSLLAFALIGIAWGLMPVDPSRFRDGRLGRAFVAAAGPAVNLVLVIACGLLCVLWLRFATSLPDEVYRGGAVILWTGCSLNLILAVFNLLPVPPLDGSGILSGLSWKAYQFYQRPEAQMFGMAFVLIVFITGIFKAAWGLLLSVAASAIDLAGGPLGNPPIIPVVYLP